MLVEICQVEYLMQIMFFKILPSILCLVQFLNNYITSYFIICFYVNWIRDARSLCEYSFLKQIVVKSPSSPLQSKYALLIMFESNKLLIKLNDQLRVELCFSTRVLGHLSNLGRLNSLKYY